MVVNPRKWQLFCVDIFVCFTTPASSFIPWRFIQGVGSFHEGSRSPLGGSLPCANELCLFECYWAPGFSNYKVGLKKWNTSKTFNWSLIICLFVTFTSALSITYAHATLITNLKIKYFIGKTLKNAVVNTLNNGIISVNTLKLTI